MDYKRGKKMNQSCGNCGYYLPEPGMFKMMGCAAHDPDYTPELTRERLETNGATCPEWHGK